MPLNPEQEQAIGNMGYLELEQVKQARKLRLIRNTAVPITAALGTVEIIALDGPGRLLGLGILAVAGAEFVAVQVALHRSAEVSREVDSVMLEAFEKSSEQ